MYTNWNDKDRSVLSSYRFIERSRLIEIIQKIKQQNFANEESRKYIRKLLSGDANYHVEPLWIKVHKKCRFPEEGYFINIDDPCVRDYYDEAITATMIQSSSDYLTEKEKFYNFIKLLLSEIENDNTPSLYNSIKFENSFYLFWSTIGFVDEEKN